MKPGLKLDGVTILRRLDFRDCGPDRWEVRCSGCWTKIIRSTSALKKGGKALGREHDSLGCRRCYQRAYDAAWRMTYGVDPLAPGGGVA